MALLFIHGAGATSLTWRLQLLHFRNAFAIDLPGHPNGPGLKTIEEYVGSVEKYVKEKAIGNLVLVGHSMGGAIVMSYELRNLNSAGLILVGTGARLRVHPDILSAILRNYEEAARLIAGWAVSPSCGRVIKDRLARDMLKIRPEVTFDDFSACNKFDGMNDVEKISCPTLIICGTDDKLTPPKYSQYLHDKIRGSKLVVIPKAGHTVMLEEHRPFNGAVEAFLAELQASGHEA